MLFRGFGSIIREFAGIIRGFAHLIQVFTFSTQFRRARMVSFAAANDTFSVGLTYTEISFWQPARSFLIDGIQGFTVLFRGFGRVILLDSTDSQLRLDFKVGNQWTGIPMWSNYKIGYQIMESFLEENPEVSIEEWTEMSSEDIIAKSNYTDE